MVYFQIIQSYLSQYAETILYVAFGLLMILIMAFVFADSVYMLCFGRKHKRLMNNLDKREARIKEFSAKLNDLLTQVGVDADEDITNGFDYHWRFININQFTHDYHKIICDLKTPIDDYINKNEFGVCPICGTDLVLSDYMLYETLEEHCFDPNEEYYPRPMRPTCSCPNESCKTYGKGCWTFWFFDGFWITYREGDKRLIGESSNDYRIPYLANAFLMPEEAAKYNKAGIYIGANWKSKLIHWCDNYKMHHRWVGKVMVAIIKYKERREKSEKMESEKIS